MLGFKINNSGRDIDRLVRVIAERCASVTLFQLSSVVEQMNDSQLRGYVRAHALPQVWAEAHGTELFCRLTQSQANDVASRAVEQTVHLVTRTFSSAPTIAMPAPHIGRRAA